MGLVPLSTPLHFQWGMLLLSTDIPALFKSFAKFLTFLWTSPNAKDPAQSHSPIWPSPDFYTNLHTTTWWSTSCNYFISTVLGTIINCSTAMDQINCRLHSKISRFWHSFEGNPLLERAGRRTRISFSMCNPCWCHYTLLLSFSFAVLALMLY